MGTSGRLMRTSRAVYHCAGGTAASSVPGERQMVRVALAAPIASRTGSPASTPRAAAALAR